MLKTRPACLLRHGNRIQCLSITVYIRYQIALMIWLKTLQVIIRPPQNGITKLTLQFFFLQFKNVQCRHVKYVEIKLFLPLSTLPGPAGSRCQISLGLMFFHRLRQVCGRIGQFRLHLVQKIRTRNMCLKSCVYIKFQHWKWNASNVGSLVMHRATT